MVVAGGDYVHFVVEYGGKFEKCRVTETAFLNRELSDISTCETKIAA